MVEIAPLGRNPEDVTNQKITLDESRVLDLDAAKKEIAEIDDNLKSGLEEPANQIAIDNKAQLLVEIHQDRLVNQKYMDFMDSSVEERFLSIVSDETDLSKLRSGSEDNFTVDYTYNGKLNSDIYLKSTAGQDFPVFIKTVEVSGVKYFRLNNSPNGEFFSTDGNNNRLVIHGDKEHGFTSVKIIDRREGDELKAIKEENPSDEEIKNEKDPKKQIVAIAKKLGLSGHGIADLIGKKDIEKGFSDLQIISGTTTGLFKVFMYYLTELGRAFSGKETIENGKKLPVDIAGDFRLMIDKNIVDVKKSLSNSYEEDEIQEWSGNLSSLDFRGLARKYPREASLKNNNPAGLTIGNSAFASRMSANGIEFFEGTARPKAEGGNYYGFPNMEEGLKAYHLLWQDKLKKFDTVGEIAKNWAVDTRSYENKFGNIWNKKVAKLSSDELYQIQVTQMQIESPGMLKEMRKLGITDAIRMS